MYRAIRNTKTKLEKALALGDYAIRSTPGMKREHDEAAEGKPNVSRARPTSITYQVRALLLAIGTFSGIGAAYAIHEALWPSSTGYDATVGPSPSAAPTNAAPSSSAR